MYSESFGKSYVGCSANILERLNAHNQGKVTSTKKFRPWKIVFEEELENYEQAIKKEKYYKSAAGRRKMKIIFNELGIN